MSVFFQRQYSLQSLIHWLLLGIVMLMVFYPAGLIIMSSFEIQGADRVSEFGLRAWRIAFSDPVMTSAIWNTLTITLARQAIALPVAILLAWLIARTDIPAAGSLEFLFWLGYFLPPLPVTMGWILLLDPQYGLVNQWLTHLPFVKEAPFNIYSFWGIVWAHLTTSTIAVEVMLFTPAFRNMDATLEEASLVSGAGILRTLRRIVIPIMTPVVGVVLLLAVVHSLQAFELELILGFPFRFYVFSTQIHWLLNQQPPQFSSATALSSVILFVMVPLIILQRRTVARRDYATVGGRYKGHRQSLGKWRLPVFFCLLAVALLITLVPLLFLTLSSFMARFGYFGVAKPWTSAHWGRVIYDPVFLDSLKNTLVLAGATAILSVALFTFVAYVVIRTRFAGRAALDFASWLPSTLPGIILGLGLLSLFLGTPLLRPFYGSMLLLILATLISSMTLGVQIVKSALTQLGFELEEAAVVAGGSRWNSFRDIVVPIITPTLLLVGTLSFIAAARSVSTVALLATSHTRPLSLLQLDFLVDSRYESAAVIGIIVVVLTTGVALIARLLGLRAGIER
ncbi:MAG TPA: iron ABC transporter permease [Candidatus Binatia bacterium]